jgi:hypothetical protein
MADAVPNQWMHLLRHVRTRRQCGVHGLEDVLKTPGLPEIFIDRVHL